ncbi:HIT domain-containing protein [Clostridium sp. MCC353]|uniref:HIT family protein n=1 Tax=Clostridium sp. MCC353 TaxID=2592646 RepID=UPI001C035590|nr:HIT family protein [Clostridium sp. MCC353]MBT9776695.1 HIT domain-containing protein [Clostridium sp. MCC353]
MCKCGVCQRIELIKQGQNPYFVKELETGYVVIGDYQRFRGYTLFLCKEHAEELHFLEEEFRYKFLREMSTVAEAVYKAFKPDKLNYELLGVGNAVHMHWHFFPRRNGDTPNPGPVWKLDKSEMYHEKYRPAKLDLEELKAQLRAELDQLTE